MLRALCNLANRGEVDWLSSQFSQFIDEQSGIDSSPLMVAIAALISEQSLQGDLCIELRELDQHPWFTKLLNHEAPEYLPIIRNAKRCQAELLKSPLVGLATEYTPLVIDLGRLYLNRYWRYETAVTKQIQRRCQSSFDMNPESLETTLKELFPEEADADQRNAARKAASSGFSVISGGPGTGKTTTVVKILSLLMAMQPTLRIALAAPTGKAAARMMTSIQKRQLSAEKASPALPNEAVTIHRLLGLRQSEFEYHQDHRLPFDCIVIDEASMLDMALAYRLLEACEEDCRVILLGDRDQLASVAAGNVLGNITGHGLPLELNTTALAHSIALLSHNRRFAREGGIASLANRINSGAGNDTVELLNSQANDIQFIQDASGKPANHLFDYIIERYSPVLAATSSAQALDYFDQFRVLSATNHGPCGVKELNQAIDGQLSRNSTFSQGGIYQGQVIMATHNDRETRLSNGDTGIMWQKQGLWYGCFRNQQEGIREIALSRLPAFTSAWVSTVHKSQGSEYPEVLLFMPEDIEPRLICREMFYTAVTRSTQLFSLQSTEKAVLQAVGNVTSRRSGLAQRLGWPE